MYPDISLYIDGIWRKPVGDGMTIVNPATGAVLGHLPVATAEDLDAALDSSARGFRIWKKLPAAERAAMLHKTAAIVRARADTLAHILSSELGAPIAAARFEVMVASDILDWSAGEARRIYGRLIPSRFPEARQLAIREPIGPVYAACPWNMPAIFPTRKLAEALAAGCSVILKPAEATPGSAVEIVRAFHDAGVPPGVINLVFGKPDFISAYVMTTSRVVRKLSFTGSVPVGRQLAGLAADRLIKCTLELGGHAPTIVCDDANVEPVARLLAERKSRNSGQVCNSPTRFYVQEGVYSEFRAAFAAALAAVRVGDPLASDTAMGPLLNERRRADVAGLVEDARARGASVLIGGQPLPGAGFFYGLTALDEVTDEARIMSEEPFGPVAALQPFRTIDDVIARANSLPFGLAAYAFTASRRRLDALAEGLDVGLLGLNHCNLAASETPFGGVKDSGYGSEGGSEGIEQYLVTKFVTEAPPPQ